MGNKNEELYETIPHLLYIYVRTLFCVNKYIVPYFKLNILLVVSVLFLARCFFFQKQNNLFFYFNIFLYICKKNVLL